MHTRTQSSYSSLSPILFLFFSAFNDEFLLRQQFLLWFFCSLKHSTIENLSGKANKKRYDIRDFILQYPSIFFSRSKSIPASGFPLRLSHRCAPLNGMEFSTRFSYTQNVRLFYVNFQCQLLFVETKSKSSAHNHFEPNISTSQYKRGQFRMLTFNILWCCHLMLVRCFVQSADIALPNIVTFYSIRFYLLFIWQEWIDIL